MSQQEQVLVVERKVVERVGIFNGLMFDVDRYLSEIFVQSVPCFMNRAQVEQDPGVQAHFGTEIRKSNTEILYKLE